MKKYRRHIIAIVVTVLISVTLYAARTNSDRLSLLQPLLEYNHPFSPDIPIDSIIAWEKLLEPELQKKQQYPLLFQINLLTVQALIAEGNISLAINQANQMYQKAKEMDYPLGTALALHAIGNTYLSSSTPQAAIESYREALEVIRKIPHASQYVKTILPQLILTKLKYHQMTDIEDNIRELESVTDKGGNPQDDFHLVYCQAFYRIQTHHLPEALNHIQQAKQISQQHLYPYFHLMIKYLYSCYYTESKEYIQALTTLDELLSHTKTTNSYTSLQVQKDRAHILALMGQGKEACEAYEIFNTNKDSLDAMNYIRQINELHTLYQIDKNELDNLNRQKTILFWSWFTILFIVILIVFFILLVKRGNKKLRQSQQELEKAKKQEENSIRAKSLFLSNMSHEIRTPLNALSGFSSILTEESIDNETRKQCSDIIQQNSELLLKLINDVIDLSSLEVGKMKFKYERCDAVAICRNVIDMVEKIKQTNANVRFSTSLHSLELTTDNARLQQLLINLLINATKFTPQGSITMELEKQTEDIALFSVTDTGCGISPENQNKIFNRFEKLNENAQGTGLGLSICQLIIEQLGGKIWIDSNYKEGARFLFTHPIYHEQPGKEEAE
ncbi:HAMP domain-containing histidine kinase [Bacteroides sp. BFG-638]|uniref:ATP-binding protein n=1 Tax=Bacteroides TaxID=816 RepID=UPI00216535A1|nr:MULTISPECIES: HAMP domain-containing sensor histidine kinase [unclassified Bacteroides]MCS2951046.1 HAMP domain-containing histidine kinase [Bacteroides sp. BFG-638]MCS3314641.1 HAMP domain-containing histidine kinase [Bacteroides sp. BFG-637]